jgi:hypothetical protein
MSTKVTTYNWRHTNGTSGHTFFTYGHFREATNQSHPKNTQEFNEHFAMPLDLAWKLVNKWNACTDWKYWVDF